jgi:hypothetical protein
LPQLRGRRRNPRPTKSAVAGPERKEKLATAKRRIKIFGNGVYVLADMTVGVDDAQITHKGFLSNVTPPGQKDHWSET